MRVGEFTVVSGWNFLSLITVLKLYYRMSKAIIWDWGLNTNISVKDEVSCVIYVYSCSSSLLRVGGFVFLLSVCLPVSGSVGVANLTGQTSTPVMVITSLQSLTTSSSDPPSW